MPISKDLFDQEIDEIDEQIIEFLFESPNEAFSLEEVVEGVGLNFKSTSDEAKLKQRFLDLVNGGHIEYRNIHGMTYYSTV